ncbi:hypothetical protein [Edaphobacter bradus]|uniref:hypothetical protein n=1 Tax=Edaphobacter bradus TaxID=2259016 RepID=UPI0021E005DB|nr:hypothetical protein [Edaphobacter bradus]
MSTMTPGRYQLKSLHEEIDLFDRKLAHLLKYETFPSDAERDIAAGKMAAKRELLVRKAQQMADDGIEFNQSELPKSLRSEGTTDTQGNPPSARKSAARSLPAHASPYAGTSLDCGPELEAYKQSKAKRKTRAS